MAEYYAVLKKAIAELEDCQAEARRMVYDKARTALIGELSATATKLSTSEMSRAWLALEQAIRRVELESEANSDLVRLPASSAAPPLALGPVRKAPEPMAPSDPAEPADPLPEDVFHRAIQEALRPVRKAPEPMAPSDPAEPADTLPENVFHRAIQEELVMRAETDQYDEATADFGPPRHRAVDRAPPPVPVRRERKEPPDDRYSRDQPPAKPRVAPEYARDWDSRRRRAETGPTDRRDQPSLPSQRKRGYLEEGDVLEREAQPSRLPSLLRTILIIAVILGGGTFAWSKRAAIVQVITELDARGAATAPTDRGARLDPSVFDVTFYRASQQDISAAGPTDEQLKDHWLAHGIKEGRQASAEYDVRTYLARYPDLVAAFGATGYDQAVLHYVTLGRSEGRSGRPDKPRLASPAAPIRSVSDNAD